MDWTKALPAVIGVLAFLISLYNLWRAKINAAEVRSLAYAQRKREVFNDILVGEASHLGVKVQAQDLRDDAEDADVAEATHVAEQAKFLIEQCNRALALLGNSREILASAASSGRSHEDLIQLVEEHAVAVSEFSNKSKIEAEAAAVLQPARRLLRLIQAAKKPGKA